MSLHADVSVPARDRARLERLCRYIARPPLALERLEELPDGRLAYRLKTRWRDGTTHIVMERHELLERLAPLIPPPRAHQIRYHGILAPCASGRDRVVPRPDKAGAPSGTSACGAAPTGAIKSRPPSEVDVPRSPREALAEVAAAPGQSRPLSPIVSERGPASSRPVDSLPGPSQRSPRLSWAELLQRVFGVDALRCRCGERMRILAAITDPAVAQRILVCMGLPPRAPPLGPAESPEPLTESWLDGPEADFDQTPPSDWAMDT